MNRTAQQQSADQAIAEAKRSPYRNVREAAILLEIGNKFDRLKGAILAIQRIAFDAHMTKARKVEIIKQIVPTPK